MSSHPRRPLLPWIVASIGCLIIAGVSWWHLRAPQAPAAPAEHEEDAAVLAYAPVSHPATHVPLPAAPPADGSADPAGDHARVQAIVDRTRERLIARHAAERVDPAWSNAMELELVELADSDQIRALHANVSNLEVDCRTTMCRMRGDVPSITAGDDFVTLYMTNLGSRMPEAAYRYVRDDDGALHIEIFGIGRR